MATVLVTGGAGFIGSHLVERLLARGDRIVVLDNFNDFYDPARKHRNLDGVRDLEAFRLVEGDLRDEPGLERLLERERPQAVVHLAAMAGVRPSVRDPALYEDVNVRGTVLLLEACRRHGVERFVFGSSSSVYGAGLEAPFHEDDCTDRPVSPYAATKKAGEVLCHAHHHLHGLRVACLRFFTVYGPRQRPEMAIHKFTRCLEAGEEIVLFGDGTSRRDYTFVTDILDGVVAALDRCPPFGIFNLGGSVSIELRELVARLEEATGRKARIRWEQPQAGDVPLTCAAVDRARAELGYEPKVAIPEGLDRFVAWYREERARGGVR